MSVDIAQAKAAFARHFGHDPESGARAPGRVNIIGEHTDYNHGFVFPMAIERDTLILARKTESAHLRVFAANFEQEATVPLGAWERHPACPWMDYVVGVAREVELLGHRIPGMECLLVGDVPIGSGLSSSASVEMAALRLLEEMAGLRLSDPDAAALGQRVENHFLGVASGIMDQFVVRAGREGHALFLDCRTNVYEQIPLALADAVFVVADTGVSRGLAGSKYNERVAECAQAVKILNAGHATQSTHLRDFGIDQLEAVAPSMPEHVYRRARHVITENDRTREASRVVKSGDAARLGELMNESDRSLRADYEVTCAELDAMTAIARELPGCHGSRMTGAGFGGCTVHLVSGKYADEFCARLSQDYERQTGRKASSFVSRASTGADVTGQ
ncbi:MAG: galactokinase [Candidatus Hydrogenedentes bacterium]|nr:galactokinase [Candidatus Hydrogenedentota bacterium]